ncbi:MAG: AMP-binding protein [Rhodospirillales bacterium]
MQTGSANLISVDEDALPLNRFYRWERERAGRPFLTQPLHGNVREWTWAQAGDEVRRVAAYLKSQDWEPGTHIAILSKNCAWWIMADLAIWMAGHVTVPVYASFRAATVREILEHSESKACFIGLTDERSLPGIPAGVERIRFPTVPEGPGRGWDAILATLSPLEGEPVRPAADLATIFYTSGTSGAPKGVMHNFAALAFVAQTLARRLPSSGEHRALSYLPLGHIFERGAMEMPALVLGWHVFFSEGVETFLADLRRARPTVFLAVPRVLIKLREGVLARIAQRRLGWLFHVPLAGRVLRKRVLRELGLDQVQVAACGGAPLEPGILLWYRKLGLNLLEGYGLTEGMITHLSTPGSLRPGYIGTALDGVEAKRAPNGEFLLKSPMNMLGYYKDPQGTRDAFTPDGFLRTGDLIETAPDGQARIIGRIKEQFKTSKGEYVTPAPIEAKLLAHNDVESCCLMGAGQAHPFAVLVLQAEARRRSADPAARKALEDSLLAALDEVNAQLEHHERLAFLVIAGSPWTVANGLLTPTMKLRRAALEVLYAPYVEEWRARNQRIIWQKEEQPGAGAPHTPLARQS